ncbi:MAG TPA: response regulator [Rhizomicrobium sp.]
MAVRILVIDDDDAVRDSIVALLSSMAFEVVEACDGRDGVEKFAIHKPQIVLTDIVMPRQEGIETIVKIRQADPDVKIIAMSGGGRIKSQEYLALAKGLGADLTLDKPFSLETLADAIRQCLG